MIIKMYITYNLCICIYIKHFHKCNVKNDEYIFIYNILNKKYFILVLILMLFIYTRIKKDY